MFLVQQAGESLLADFRRPGRATSVAWLLALLVLAQVFLPIQSHTRWAVAEDGQVVEMCTLHGAVAVTIDPVTGQPLPVVADDDRSAAMAFSQLLAEALSGHAHMQPAWLALAAVDTPPAVIGIPTRPAPRHAPIRAPPALV